ncbi:MAG: hypothetical protein IKO91_06690 [Oscillospiraceae bacterium]|nr:hypothetical protein [Oscillospiraceae bacterium]
MRESLRERLQAKLRSGRGASITFALLLFLVCAVVGSVVLAAGTAASGRVSQLAEADRRYYAVTSAAQLFRDELNGQSYTIVREMSKTDTYNRTYGDSIEDSLLSEDQVYSLTFQQSGQPNDLVRGSSLLGDAALDLVLGRTEDPMDSSRYASVYEHIPIFEPAAGDAEWPTWSKNLTVTVGEETDDLPVVLVEVTMNKQGTMGFTYKNKEESGEGAFVLSFTLTLNDPGTKVYEGNEVETEDNFVYNDGKIEHSKVTKTKVSSKTNELMWTASEIRNGAAEIGS